MNPNIQLPPPAPATRQVGVTSMGSPISLSRSSSNGISTPEESLRDRLVIYKTYLEHELDFLENEINALVQRQPSNNPRENAAFLDLRDGLKIRYNNMRNRLNRVDDLLNVL